MYTTKDREKRRGRKHNHLSYHCKLQHTTKSSAAGAAASMAPKGHTRPTAAGAAAATHGDGPLPRYMEH